MLPKHEIWTMKCKCLFSIFILERFPIRSLRYKYDKILLIFNFHECKTYTLLNISRSTSDRVDFHVVYRFGHFYCGIYMFLLQEFYGDVLVGFIAKMDRNTFTLEDPKHVILHLLYL